MFTASLRERESTGTVTTSCATTFIHSFIYLRAQDSRERKKKKKKKKKKKALRGLHTIPYIYRLDTLCTI